MRHLIFTLLAASLTLTGCQSINRTVDRAPMGQRLDPGAPWESRVKVGLDVLAEQKFESLKGRKVGLITNHSGLQLEIEIHES